MRTFVTERREGGRTESILKDQSVGPITRAHLYRPIFLTHQLWDIQGRMIIDEY